MDSYAVRLNAVFVDTFRLILKVEEKSIKNTEKINLSISEMHLIEVVGKREEGRSVSEIAAALGVTLPSVTVAINKLVKKGYVRKGKNARDGRAVAVSLTRAGKKMHSVHRHFHEQMARRATEGFSEQEKIILIDGIEKVNAFLKQKIAEMEAP